MNNQVRFTCTALAGSGKKGILPKDEFGYYIQPIGALNCFNSAGEYYVYEGAKQLFQQSSSFMRRVSSGCLKAEQGHPKKLPGQTDDSFAARVMTIDPTNVCAAIGEVFLDFNNVKGADGKPVIAIMGKIKPSGPFAAAMEASFENPKEDVCFSVRAFTSDSRIGGINQRTLVEVVTFDNVVEPGIHTSRKYYSPALESYNDSVFSQDAMVKATTPIPGIAMESAVINSESLFKLMGWNTEHLLTPSYFKW